MKRLILIALLIGCGDFIGPTGAHRIQPTAVTAAAMQWVDTCAGYLPVVRKWTDLKFYAVPGEVFDYQEFKGLGGYGHKDEYYIAEGLLGDTAIWAHELLHATRGLPGKSATDHPFPFWYCKLDPRQL